MMDKVTQIVGLTVRAAAVVQSFENIDHICVRPAVDSQSSLHEMECSAAGQTADHTEQQEVLHVQWICPLELPG